MPEITICTNKNCPLGKDCYRLNAIPDEHWQAYADFSSGYDVENNTFQYYQKTRKEVISMAKSKGGKGGKGGKADHEAAGVPDDFRPMHGSNHQRILGEISSMTCNLLSCHPVQNQQPKICLGCSSIFNRTYQSEKIWSKQIYCSRKCSCLDHNKKLDISSGQITCRVCNISKPLNDFDKRNNSYYSICRSCKRQEGKERSKLSSFKKSRSTIRYEQLLKFEEVRFNTECFIEVKCKKSECRKWFMPSMRQIDDRVRAFNGTSTGDSEHNFYCSDECKGTCELYGKQSMPEIKAIESGMSYDEYLRTKTERDAFIWNFVREKVKKLDNNMCCVCGSDQNIEVHHQIPAALNPMIMYDPDNLITLCEKCHVNIHSGDCSYHSISRKSCHKKYYYKNGNGMPKEWSEYLRQSKYNGENKKDLSGQRF